MPFEHYALLPRVWSWSVPSFSTPMEDELASSDFGGAGLSGSGPSVAYDTSTGFQSTDGKADGMVAMVEELWLRHPHPLMPVNIG